MNKEVAIVLKNPLGVTVTFGRDRKLASLFLHLQVDFVRNCLILPDIHSSANYKKIGEAGDICQVEN